MNQITLATTAIAIAIPSVTMAASWNRRRGIWENLCSLRAFLRLTDAVEKSGFLLIVTVFRLRCTGSCY